MKSNNNSDNIFVDVDELIQRVSMKIHKMLSMEGKSSKERAFISSVSDTIEHWAAKNGLNDERKDTNHV